MSDVLIDRVLSIGGNELSTLFIAMLLAGEDGRVVQNRDELALTLGVTVQTVRKRLNSLEELGLVKNLSDGSIAVSLPPEGFESFLSHVLCINSFSLVSTSTNTNITYKDVMGIFSRKYRHKYGTNYSYGNWAIASAIAKKFAVRYGVDSEPILNVIFDNYGPGKVWGSAQYPRPTFGAVCGWLGEQASAYVRAQVVPAQVVRDVDIRELI